MKSFRVLKLICAFISSMTTVSGMETTLLSDRLTPPLSSPPLSQAIQPLREAERTLRSADITANDIAHIHELLTQSANSLNQFFTNHQNHHRIEQNDKAFEFIKYQLSTFTFEETEQNKLLRQEIQQNIRILRTRNISTQLQSSSLPSSQISSSSPSLPSPPSPSSHTSPPLSSLSSLPTFPSSPSSPPLSTPPSPTSHSSSSLTISREETTKYDDDVMLFGYLLRAFQKIHEYKFKTDPMPQWWNDYHRKYQELQKFVAGDQQITKRDQAALAHMFETIKYTAKFNAYPLPTPQQMSSEYKIPAQSRLSILLA